MATILLGSSVMDPETKERGIVVGKVKSGWRCRTATGRIFTRPKASGAPKVGRRCKAQPKPEIPSDDFPWMEAVVVQSEPLNVEVVELDDVWRGAVLTRSNARIRVSIESPARSGT